MLLTVKQAAERLGVKPSTIYDLVTGRKIRFARIGNGRGRIRISEDAIDEYVARVTFAPQEPKAAPTRVKLKHLSLD
jgi:excisionase family DNA binding protein